MPQPDMHFLMKKYGLQILLAVFLHKCPGHHDPRRKKSHGKGRDHSLTDINISCKPLQPCRETLQLPSFIKQITAVKNHHRKIDLSCQTVLIIPVGPPQKSPDAKSCLIKEFQSSDKRQPQKGAPKNYSPKAVSKKREPAQKHNEKEQRKRKKDAPPQINSTIAAYIIDNLPKTGKPLLCHYRFLSPLPCRPAIYPCSGPL